LSDRVRQHGYPALPEVLHIATDVLDVLAAAHAQGIVHRDIKPANLFLLRDGRLKVLDFGVARVQSGQQLTRLGTRLGTVAYMPPEQVRGEPIDARADLFAVGATMFRLIGQRRVHEAETDDELVVKMATLPAPPLATVAPHTPEPVCRVVDRALQFDAAARHPDAATMRDDVRAVGAGHPPPFARGARPAVMGGPAPSAQVAPPVVPAPPPPRPSAAPTPGRRARWALVAFPLLGLAVVVLAFQCMVRLGVRDEAHRSEGDAAVVDAGPAPSAVSPPPGPAPVKPSGVPPSRAPVAEPAAP